MASTNLCVRLLSGATVYEGLRPNSLAELRDEVAATMGCECDELFFCSKDAVLQSIEDADEQITAFRDKVMGLLPELLKYTDYGGLADFPEHLWHAREHRRLLLAAVAINGYALRHASPELRADRILVLAAVKRNGHALQYAAAQLKADRDVVLAAVASKMHSTVAINGHALRHASYELQSDRKVVLAAVATNGCALQYASLELKADRDLVLAAVASEGLALQHACPELRADRAVVLAAEASNWQAYCLAESRRKQTEARKEKKYSRRIFQI